MKLSMYTGTLNDHAYLGLTQTERLKLIRGCGFTCVDYSCDPYMVGDGWKVHAETAKTAMAEAGVVAMQGHAPCVNPLLPGNIDLLHWADNILSFCRAAGIPQVVIHPGAVDGNTREQFFDANVAFYKSLIPAAERNRVGVLIENIGNYADPYSDGLSGNRAGASLPDSDRVRFYGACRYPILLFGYDIRGHGGKG